METEPQNDSISRCEHDTPEGEGCEECIWEQSMAGNPASDENADA